MWAPLTRAVEVSTPAITAPERFAPSRLAPFTSAPSRMAPQRLASFRLAPDSLAPLQRAVAKVGLEGGHPFELRTVQRGARKVDFVDLALAGFVTQRLEAAARMGNGDLAFAEVRLGQVRLGEIGPSQTGAAQVGANQRGLAHDRFFEDRSRTG